MHFRVLLIAASVCLLAMAYYLEGASAKKTIHLTKDEYKALRREMIEMDLALRNLISAIAISFPNESRRLFERLSEYQITQLQRTKTVAKKLLRKIEKAGRERYFKKIHSAATKGAEGADKIAKNKSSSWSSVESAVQKVVTACRECHEKTEVIWK